jgi:hypothetical protein
LRYKLLARSRPETAIFSNLGVNLRVSLCGVPKVASAQTLGFLRGGRHVQQQMHVIRSHVTLHDLDVQPPTYLPRRPPDFLSDVTPQHRLAVFRDEHKVVPQPKHCV